MLLSDSWVLPIPGKVCLLWVITQEIILFAISSFESNVVVAIIGGIFALFNTILALWWVGREKRARRDRFASSDDDNSGAGPGDKLGELGPAGVQDD